MQYEIGQVIYQDDELTINADREAVSIVVKNTGDRTVQICSHYHFFECNKALQFDRETAYGMHLDIPSGTAVRFEPGADREVKLVPYKGQRMIYGFAGWVMGQADDPEIRANALTRCKEELENGL